MSSDCNCSYQIDGETYYGSTPKFRLDIDAGMPMSDYNFYVELVGTGGRKTIEKNVMPKDKDNNFYLCFDTVTLGVGPVKAIVTAEVPDTAFPPTNIRKEVYVINRLMVIRSV